MSDFWLDFNDKVADKAQYLNTLKSFPANFIIKDSDQKVSVYENRTVVTAH